MTDVAPILAKKQGRTYIPHECGMCGLADGVLCLSAQKETAELSAERSAARGDLSL